MNGNGAILTWAIDGPDTLDSWIHQRLAAVIDRHGRETILGREYGLPTFTMRRRLRW
ncbi:MAG: hypothetical protein ACI9C1_001043 [Candidatus Aldehydirespiratoraceae bacterium]|jgi:hypothetical protein